MLQNILNAHIFDNTNRTPLKFYPGNEVNWQEDKCE